MKPLRAAAQRTGERLYTCQVAVLLSATFILTLARAMALPYLVVYCAQRFAMGVAHVGLALGGALVLSSLLGVYGGFLVDRFVNRRVMLTAGALFALAFGLAFQTGWPALFFAAILVINLSYAVIDVAVKSGIAALVEAQKRGSVFSIKYTLTNVAFAAGPFLGVALAQVDSGLPFAVAGLLGVSFCMLYAILGEQSASTTHAQALPPGFARVLSHLLKDPRLVCFTVGGLLSAVVFGQFSAYLSQYLLVTRDPEQTYKIINALVTTNACIVICLQYLVGSRIHQDNLWRMLCIGMAFFLIGLMGFAQANSLPFWIMAMIVFTVGEIIIIPTEYLFIDFIAPPALRGVYYGAQNLSNLGAALGPALCGAALSWLAPSAMFYLLGLCLLAALMFYHRGYASRGYEDDPL